MNIRGAHNITNFPRSSAKKCATRSIKKTRMQIASLRFWGIYTEEHRALLVERGSGALWNSIDVHEARAPAVCLPDTIMDTSTAELAAKYLPQVQSGRKAENRVERPRYCEGGKDAGLSR